MNSKLFENYGKNQKEKANFTEDYINSLSSRKPLSQQPTQPDATLAPRQKAPLSSPCTPLTLQTQQQAPLQQMPPGQVPSRQPPFSQQPPMGQLPDMEGPPSATDYTYIPGYLKSIIGKTIRAEFVLGTNIFTDRTGKLIEVGTNYFVLQELTGNLVMCDLYSVRFVTILNV